MTGQSTQWRAGKSRKDRVEYQRRNKYKLSASRRNNHEAPAKYPNNEKSITLLKYSTIEYTTIQNTAEALERKDMATPNKPLPNLVHYYNNPKYNLNQNFCPKPVNSSVRSLHNLQKLHIYATLCVCMSQNTRSPYIS